MPKIAVVTNVTTVVDKLQLLIAELGERAARLAGFL